MRSSSGRPPTHRCGASACPEGGPIAATPSGEGYWLVSADGGVFCFGDAPYLGSLLEEMGGEVGFGAAVDIDATPFGDGYWVATGQT